MKVPVSEVNVVFAKFIKKNL